MTQNRKQAAGPDKKHPGNNRSGEMQTNEGSEDNCRCKEVSKKTLPEMIKLMLKDLTFWKK